jgi:hypothetical protein
VSWLLADGWPLALSYLDDLKLRAAADLDERLLGVDLDARPRIERSAIEPSAALSP